ncbi:MAG TPA: hypothetical protein VIV57_25680, partial [Anaeromyxobacter sp.]
MRSCAERPSAAALASGAVLAWAALLACSAASPETEVKEALARLGAVELPAGGPAAVALQHLRFADVAVSMDGPRALVLAVVEADGTAMATGASLVYVGREAFSMERCRSSRWCLSDLPALSGVVAALRAVPREAGARVVAWQVRVERDAATAGEDYEVGGQRLRVR